MPGHEHMIDVGDTRLRVSLSETDEEITVTIHVHQDGEYVGEHELTFERYQQLVCGESEFYPGPESTEDSDAK